MEHVYDAKAEAAILKYKKVSEVSSVVINLRLNYFVIV